MNIPCITISQQFNFNRYFKKLFPENIFIHDTFCQDIKSSVINEEWLNYKNVFSNIQIVYFTKCQTFIRHKPASNIIFK